MDAAGMSAEGMGAAGVHGFEQSRRVRGLFRINPVNFRTRRAHMDELFALLAAECGRAHAEEAAEGGG